MDLGPLVHLGPPGRLSPETSRLFVDYVFGGGLLAVIAFVSALAYRAWAHAKRLGAEVWKARGLRAGPILLPGVAQPLEGDNGPSTHFIELVIDQRGHEGRDKHGHYVSWKETSRKLTERPFELRCENDERVRVEPGTRIELVDRLDVTERTSSDTRRRIARITNGEAIWVRGILVGGDGGGGVGPYRASASSQHWVLRAPGRDPMYVSSEPVETEDLAAAKLDRNFAIAYLVFFVACQLGFADYRALHAHGVETQARLVDKSMWTTRTKNGLATHFAFDVSYAVDGQTITGKEETNRDAYFRYDRDAVVPLTYLPTRPAHRQLGRRNDVGADDGPLILSILFGVFLTLVYPLARHGRKPWWRRKKLCETTRGRL